MQVRDLDSHYYESAMLMATTVLEKYSQEGSDVETLPEEARVLVGDKDIFMTAIQVMKHAEGQ